MTSTDPGAIDGLLSGGLRERAADLGDEAAFQRRVIAAAAAVLQRRGWIGWDRVFGRGRALVLVAALVGTALVAAAIGGAFNAPIAPPAAANNGPILVVSTGTSWWIDGTTGDVITAGLPRLPRGVQAAAWSRDGLHLAIVVDGDLELVDPATGARTVVARCAEIDWPCRLEVERSGSIDWAPDARSIAVARPRGIVRIDVDSGTRTSIIHWGKDAGIANLSWSPDGRWIAFEHIAEGPEGGDVSLKRRVEVVRADGSDRHRVSPPTPPTSYGAGQPLWSPDGKQLVYLTSDPWIESDGDLDTGGWPLKATVLDIADGDAAGPVRHVDLLRFYCLGFCPTFTLAPDGLSVLIDTGDGLVLAPLDGSPQVELAPDSRVLAWRPEP